MKTIIMKCLVLGALCGTTLSINAQLKLNSSGFLTYGQTNSYNDGAKYYDITMRGNFWLAGPTNGHFFQIDTNAAATRIAGHDDQIVFYNTGTGVFNSIQVKNVYNYSDIRAKKDIAPLSKKINSLNKLLLLKPVSYNFQDNSDVSKYKIGGDGKEYGLIAQEVESVIPNAVITDPDGKKLINYNAVISVLIDAVQKLEQQITILEKSNK